MTKKITLSELKVKSSITEINSAGRKATKGGHVQKRDKDGGGRIKIKTGGNWIADTTVDIRFTSTNSDDLNP